MTEPPLLEFWYEFGSTYSYLSMMRVEAEATQAGVEVRYRPFLLGPIFKGFGWTTSPFVQQPRKGKYMWRDLERRCTGYGLPWKRPSEFPRTSLLATRVAILGQDEAWVGAFSRAVMQCNFVADEDIADEKVIAKILEELSLPSATVVELAQAQENKRRLRLQTAHAADSGIFGAPSFMVDHELFWGDDRLEDALAWAVDSGHARR